MAKITYQGESPSVTWYGQAFEKGKAVEVDNPDLIAAAQRNPLFATAALVDAKTKASIKAEEEARAEAEKRAEEDAAAEAARVLALNAGDDSGEEGEGDDGGEADRGVEASSPVARRGRPRKG